MAYLQARDKSGKVIDRKLPKGQIHGPKSSPDIYCATSHIWIYNDKGEILMQKRSKNVSTHPGKWDISAAGHIDYGETPEQAALRELSEELGVELDPKDLHFVFKMQATKPIPPSGWIHNEFVWVYLLNLSQPAETFTLQEEEVDELEWVSLERLRKEVHDTEIYEKKYVPHGEYYDRIIKEVAKLTGKN